MKDWKSNPEEDALNVHPVYNIERSGNLIERMTFNNISAAPDCRLLRLTYKSHGRITVEALDDGQRRIGQIITLMRTNKGVFVYVVVAEPLEEMAEGEPALAEPMDESDPPDDEALHEKDSGEPDQEQPALGEIESTGTSSPSRGENS